MGEQAIIQGPSQLSPLEWIMPRSYISQILCFPSSNARISDVLRDGLAGTLNDVPYLASRIVARAHPKGSVALSSPCDSLGHLFRVNTYTDVDYEALKSGAFQPSIFDDQNWFSPDVSPGNTSPSPVFRAVLTLVKGGCLLAVSLHHQTADITAYGSLLKIWASHCRTGSSRGIGFDQSWLDRTAIVRSCHDALPDTPLLLHKEESVPPSQPPKPAKLETRYLKFSEEYLKDLKGEVNKQLPDGTAWVSTSDVLTALLWGYTIHSEFLDDDNTAADGKCFMRIAVNSRSRYDPPLPKDYLGSSFGVTLVTAAKADLVAIGSSTEHNISMSKIANVAAAVRQSIQAINEYSMNRIVNHLAAQEDVSGLKLCEQAADVSIVSWADEGVYELDWGAEVGHCEAVRLSSLKGKRYPVVFPRLPNGDLEVLVTFDEELMSKWRMAHKRSPWRVSHEQSG
ncbi:transferase [Trichoderma austrokoningii]